MNYWKSLTVVALFCLSLALGGVSAAAQAGMAGIDMSKISDMSHFDPVKYENPPGGDTIKIGLIDAFSGPSAINGEIYWMVNSFVAYDINARGGITVDGQKKLIEIVKGDNQGKAATCKKVSEHLCLEEKVDILWGNSGSHLALITQHVAKKYKTIYHNAHNMGDHLMNAHNFNRYTFNTGLNATMFANAMAYAFKSLPQRKFYILNQDYKFGHDLSVSFKDALAKCVPDARVVGETYHPLYLKDFAPYITKVMATDADVIFTGDWMPDAGNLFKTTRALGINIPVANIYITDANTLTMVGGQAGRGLVNINDYMITIETPENQAFVKLYHNSWKNWSFPYNRDQYQWPASVYGNCISALYWLYSVIERANATDPEKIIALWEGDEFRSFKGVIKMRPDDHMVIEDLYVSVFEYPSKYQEKCAYYGKAKVIPAEYCMSSVDPALEGRAQK